MSKNVTETMILTNILLHIIKIPTTKTTVQFLNS